MRRATKNFRLNSVNFKSSTLLLAISLLTLLIIPAASAQSSDSLRIGCPIEFEAPSQDTVIDIPVYATNVENIGGFSLGFHYNSDLVEIDSVNAWGSVIPTTIPIPGFPPILNVVTYPDDNLILVGWYDSDFQHPITPHSDGYWFTMKMSVKAGISPSCIDIDSSFVPPAGDFIFSPSVGGQLTPEYINCGTCDVHITGGAIPPVAQCQNVVVEADGNCEADASIDDGSYDPGGLTLTLTQDPPGPYPLGVTNVKLIASNSSGLADTCEATVTVEDNTAPALTCPDPITVGNDPGECGAVVNFQATATDNCGIESITYDPSSGTTFSIGTTPVEVIAVDASGNADTCSFDVTVNDTEAPVAVCPGDITVDNDPGECGAVVTFTAGATDNCEGATATATPPSGTFFPKGTSQVMVIAEDAAGLKDTCYFNVTVNDSEAPVLTCPGDIIQSNDPGECGAVVTYDPTATDNCPGSSVVANPSSGTFFDLGTTTVEVIATDAAGNADTCSFDVTVNDDEDPVITCPADTAIQLALDQTDKVVEFSVTATDNCPGVNVVSTPASGSVFSLGETTVNSVATDAAGNTANCSFKVTLIPPNYPPTAYDTAITTQEDVAVNAQLQASDPESDALTYEIVDGPYNGTLTAFDANTGAFTYLGNANFNGADSLTFKAKDLTNQSNIATVRITVTPVADAPIPRDTSITTAEDTPVDGNLYADNIDGGPLTFAVTSGPSHGTLTAFDQATGAFTYSPDKDYYGSDDFTFSVDNALVEKALEGTVSITITPVNDAPVARDTSVTTQEDVALNAYVYGYDIDDATITFELVTQPSHGSITAFDGNTGAFTYESNLNYNGSDSFTFKAYDGELYSDPATVSITITPVNDEPVARDSSIIVVQNEDGYGQCQGYDIEGDPLYFYITGGPSYGEISNFDNLTGTFTYTPDTDYLGPDTLFFGVEEDKIGSEGFVAISVVEPAFFVFDPDSIFFTANEYGPNPESVLQQITSASPTGADFEWFAVNNADWLTISADSGTTPSEVEYSADISGLLPGSYEASVIFHVMLTAAGSGGPSDTVVVTLTVDNPVANDSVVVHDAIALPGDPVMVELYGRNSAPTVETRIPLVYDASVLTYDSTILVGTRLETAESSILNYTYDSELSIVSLFTHGTLDPGAGQFARIYFTINLGAAPGTVAQIGLADGEDFSFLLDEDHGSARVVPTFVAGEVTVDFYSDVNDNDLTLPDAYALNQNYPNPFNPETVIEYNLPHAAQVRLTVFNIVGQEVTTLVSDYQSAGVKRVIWDGTDAHGLRVTSGVYFYRLSTADFDMTRKMIMMK
jgi:hypothetical protein